MTVHNRDTHNRDTHNRDTHNRDTHNRDTHNRDTHNRDTHNRDAHSRDAHHLLNETGQATTEYALVLLGAALVGLILITWATAGGTESRIGRLLDTVVDTITSRL